MISLRETTMTSRCAAIIPVTEYAPFGLARPKPSDFVPLALCASFARVTVHREVTESRMFIG